MQEEDCDYLELREWAPLWDLWQRIPETVIKSFVIKRNVEITCLDAVDEFLALGSNVGIVFWYNRAKRKLHQFKCDVSKSK